MKAPQPIGKKGSLKWIQILINNCSHILDQHLLHNLKLDLEKIEWLSPLKKERYAEYRDDDFLNLLGLEKFNEKLHDFWPKRGPQWDALGKGNEKGPYFLVEAKANIPEIISSSQAKSEKSISRIKDSLFETQKYLNCKSPLNWESGLYQYSNRIAHLYFLRCLCKVEAYMIFIYFLDDHTHIPTSKQEWTGAIYLQKQLMGLKRHKLQRYVVDVFLDVNEIDNRTSG